MPSSKKKPRAPVNRAPVKPQAPLKSRGREQATNHANNYQRELAKLECKKRSLIHEIRKQANDVVNLVTSNPGAVVSMPEEKTKAAKAFLSKDPQALQRSSIDSLQKALYYFRDACAEFTAANLAALEDGENDDLLDILV